MTIVFIHDAGSLEC